jgi:adenosylcobinamide kinase / adenosylcobinamide-phosphate guanylyltransferase
MKKITLITGGQRSGKSSYALKLAELSSPNPIYLATARHWDQDFTARIQRHQSERGSHWETIEEEKHLGKLNIQNRVILLDCITLWLNNFFHDSGYDTDKSLSLAKKEWDTFSEKENNLIVVTNELGMGIHSSDEISRKFTDLQGWMNQYIALSANEAILMVSGIPVTIKQAL